MQLAEREMEKQIPCVDGDTGNDIYAAAPAKMQNIWERDASRISNKRPLPPYTEGQVNSATRSQFHGQMPNSGLGLEKATEQDMEIGYEDGPSTLTFEALEKKFRDEIMKLAEEQSDAEAAESARHRERKLEISNQYQEKLLALRSLQAKRREEFLYKEAQERIYKHQQTVTSNHRTDSGPVDPHRYQPSHYQASPRGYGPSHYSTERVPADSRRYGPNYYPTGTSPMGPHGYGGAAAVEPHRGYAPGPVESYRERSPYLQVQRNQQVEGRVPMPQGRAYENTRARNY